MSLSRNHDLILYDNTPTLLQVVSWRYYVLSISLSTSVHQPLGVVDSKDAIIRVCTLY